MASTPLNVTTPLTTVMHTTIKLCPRPNIAHGNAIYSSPAAVVITCYAGYVIRGADVLKCLNDGNWDRPTPSCVQQIPFYNKVIVNNDDEMPSWLAILLGVSAGISALLLLACLVYMCLKCCGCISGSDSQVYPFGSRSSGCCCRRDIDIEQSPPSLPRDNNVRRKLYNNDHVFIAQNHPQKNRRNLESNDCIDENRDSYQTNFCQPQLHRQANHQVQHHTMVRENIQTSSDSGMSSRGSPRFVRDIIQKEERRKKAVMPIWMPHQNPIRNINTSTR